MATQKQTNTANKTTKVKTTDITKAAPLTKAPGLSHTSTRTPVGETTSIAKAIAKKAPAKKPAAKKAVAKKASATKTTEAKKIPAVKVGIQDLSTRTKTTKVLENADKSAGQVKKLYNESAKEVKPVKADSKAPIKVNLGSTPPSPISGNLKVTPVPTKPKRISTMKKLDEVSALIDAALAKAKEYGLTITVGQFPDGKPDVKIVGKKK